MILKYQIDKEEFIEVFNQSGGNVSAVARHFNIPRGVAENRRKIWGLPKINVRTAKFKFNEHYFDKIDSFDKAYWLGYIFGAGCVCKPANRTPDLTVSGNETILQNLVSVMDGNNNIHNKKCYWDVTFTSAHLCEEITKLGKSWSHEGRLTTKFPDINKKYYYSFIHGFICANSSYYRADANDKVLSISGSLNVLKTIQEIIGLGGYLSYPRANYNGYSLRYTGKKQLKKIIELVVKNGRNSS